MASMRPLASITQTLGWNEETRPFTDFPLPEWGQFAWSEIILWSWPDPLDHCHRIAGLVVELEVYLVHQPAHEVQTQPAHAAGIEVGA